MGEMLTNKPSQTKLHHVKRQPSYGLELLVIVLITIQIEHVSDTLV